MSALPVCACVCDCRTPNYASLSALMSYPQTPRDDLECLVYCLFEMEHPTLRLPWNRDLTTNEEAKDGWSMRQLERMSKKKEQAWRAACKRVRCAHYMRCRMVVQQLKQNCVCQWRLHMLAGALASYAASCWQVHLPARLHHAHMCGTCLHTKQGDADMLCPACTCLIEG
jgi:hypothetical protein